MTKGSIFCRNVFVIILAPRIPLGNSSYRARASTNLRVLRSELRRFALRFTHSHSGATGVLWSKCRFVYFRFGAKMTGASSKIDVRRLKVEDTNTNISTFCITRSSDQRPSSVLLR